MSVRYQSVLTSCLVVVLGSVAVAFWTHMINPIINPDGVKYVLAAEHFIQGDFERGLEAYKWPLYSMTIAVVAQVTALPMETSALVFNGLMRVVGGLGFIYACRLIGGNSTQMLQAALFYVAYPGLNEVQAMIIRDFAYLALFIWMVVFFMRQTINPTRFNFYAFMLLGVVATGYRIEGAAFVLGLWVYHLLTGTRSRSMKRAGLALVLILLPIFIYGILSWIFDGDPTKSVQAFSDQLDLIENNLDEILAGIKPQWLSSILGGLYYPGIVVLPLVRLIVNMVEILTIGYLLILVVGWSCRRALKAYDPSINLILAGWKWIVGINILVLIGFVLVTRIVTDRYPLSLCLLLMLLMPFAITAIINRLQVKSSLTRKIALGALSLVLLANTIEGLDRFSAKHHVKQAGQWIASQPGTEHKKRVYSNDRILDYYAGQTEVKLDNYYSLPVLNAMVLSPRWSKLDFLAVNLSHKKKPGFYRNFRYRTGKEPDRIFENHQGDKVLVYDLRDRIAY